MDLGVTNKLKNCQRRANRARQVREQVAQLRHAERELSAGNFPLRAERASITWASIARVMC
jgi:hypothetical protein